MSKLTKFAASSLAAATLLVGVSLSSQAEARHWHVGAGIVGAAIIGSAIIASTAPRCHYVERFDPWGNYMGTRRVCYGY